VLLQAVTPVQDAAFFATREVIRLSHSRLGDWIEAAVSHSSIAGYLAHTQQQADEGCFWAR
jgi:hypothetical protein